MAIELPCPGCGRTLRVGDEHAGKKARCPECQTITTVPLASTGPASSSETPFGSELPSGGGFALPTQGDSESSRSTEPQGSQASAGAMWQMKTPEGQIYGPVSWDELQAWRKANRISRDCQLLQQGGTQWQWATTVFPDLGGPKPLGSSENPFARSTDESREIPGGGVYQAPRSGSARTYALRPHRGGLVLVLGILGLVMCGIFTGIPAWIMGSSDLKDMKAGRMDNEGYGITQAGMILGILSVAISALTVVMICCAGLA